MTTSTHSGVTQIARTGYSWLDIPQEPDFTRMRSEVGARLHAAMADQGVDALVLLGNSNVMYATGISWPLADAGLSGAMKTSGSRGVHVFVPLDLGGLQTPGEDVAAATRALAARAEALDPSIATTAFIVSDRAGKVFIDATRSGGATVAAAYSPRLRPGTPVSFPVAWSELDRVQPTDFTITTAVQRLGGRDPWAEEMPAAQRLPDDLIAQGRTIPVARVAAMHEGKRRARARRQTDT